MRNGSIQAPNSNPRPPNEPRVGNAQPLYPKNLLRNATLSKGGKEQQHKIEKRNHENKGQAGATTTGVQPASTPTSTTAPPDPRDSSYWEDVAQIKLNRTAALGRLNEAGVLEGNQYEHELNEYNYLDPEENRGLREGANVAGGIYSTATRENEGRLAQQQLARRAGALNAHQQAELQRGREADQINSEFGTGENDNPYGQRGIDAYKEAINRRVANEPTEGTASTTPTQVIQKTIIKRIVNAKKPGKNSGKNNKKK